MIAALLTLQLLTWTNPLYMADSSGFCHLTVAELWGHRPDCCITGAPWLLASKSVATKEGLRDSLHFDPQGLLWELWIITRNAAGRSDWSNQLTIDSRPGHP